VINQGKSEGSPRQHIALSGRTCSSEISPLRRVCEQAGWPRIGLNKGFIGIFAQNPIRGVSDTFFTSCALYSQKSVMAITAPRAAKKLKIPLDFQSVLVGAIGPKSNMHQVFERRSV
jgi:hypothetical protein